ncbi:tetratricopeptide repeat protein [Aequorivita sp. H23M31]|uniref:Tetratricopeptide repeat protein n=1 Tax=Aequorivita ciconiae TaxID=2494375 RepID=A0A410G318_9FLAO|nr:tetratricopeptide repeat protein [Aequorivita sp. H23M31]QAA81678.1 tetratricopeptide repeat protein [Aequorivita sp. H23M31]
MSCFSPSGGVAEGRGGPFHLGLTKIILLALVIFIFPPCTNAQSSYKQAEKYFKEKKFVQAKPIFENFLKQNPHDKKTQEYLGDIAAYAADWDTAISYYKDLVNEEESNADFHFKYGAAMGMKAMSISKIRALGYIGPIKHQLQTAAKLDPQHIDSRWALIEFYIALPGILGGSEKKALEYAKELSQISPVDGYLAKGYVAEECDRPQDAERYYKKAIEVGGSPHTYEKLAALYEKNHQPGKAIETAAKSFKLHKRNQLNYEIGRICAEYNLEPQYGIDCLKEYVANYTLEDGVTKEWAYYHIAQIYKNLDDKKNALIWIDKALSAKRDFPQGKKEKSIILSL